MRTSSRRCSPRPTRGGTGSSPAGPGGYGAHTTDIGAEAAERDAMWRLITRLPSKQRVTTVWVQVVVPAGREVALSIAERVRLDRTFRCAAPFRFSGLGDRVRVVKCETWFSGDRTQAQVWLADGDAGAEYLVRVGHAATPAATTETIGGRTVAVVGGDTPHLEYPFECGVAYFHPFYTTLDDPFLRSLVPAFVPVSDPDPHTWPRSPLR